MNKFGEKRMAALVEDLRGSVATVFTQMLLDRNQPLLDRFVLYNRAGEEQRRMAYDQVKPALSAELAESALGPVYQIDQMLAEPPGMEQYRQAQAELAKRRMQQQEQENRADALHK